MKIQMPAMLFAWLLLNGVQPALATARPNIDASSCSKIPTGEGPHSLLPLANKQHLLISSHDRRRFEKQGNIYEYDVMSGRMRILPRSGEPPHLEFRPHHMDIRESNEETLLYVINHDDTTPNSRHHSVLVYTVHDDSLSFRQQLKHPLLSSPNHLSVTSEGDIYVSNDRRDGSSNLELLLRQRKATIVHYRPGKGWRVVAEGLSFPNGIIAASNHVLVSKTFGNAILEYPRKPDGSLGSPRTVLSLPLLDGLTESPNPGHYTVVSHASLVDFLRHQRDGQHPSASTVHEVNIASGQSRVVFKDSGKRISGISAAVHLGNSIFFGQSFEPFLLRCPYS